MRLVMTETAKLAYRQSPLCYRARSAHHPDSFPAGSSAAYNRSDLQVPIWATCLAFGCPEGCRKTDSKLGCMPVVVNSHWPERPSGRLIPAAGDA